MAVIELGELRWQPDLQVYRPARSPVRALTLVAALILLCLLSAAAPTPRPLPEVTVPAGLGANLFTGSGRLVVADPAPVRPGGQGPQLTAYRLRDGLPLWRAAVPAALDGPASFVAGIDDVVLLTGGGSEFAGPGRETVAVSGSTGRQLWRLAARFYGITAGGDVLLWAQEDGSAAAGGLAGSVRAVDPTTGQPRWSYPVTAGVAWAYRLVGDRVNQIVVRLPARLELRDAATGSVLRATDLPAAAYGPVPEGWRYPQVVGDLVALSDAAGGIVTYGVDRLDRRWRVNLDDGTWLEDCGPVVCVSARAQVRALDPLTGRVRWIGAAGWGAAGSFGERLLIRRWDGQPSTTALLAVLDAGTGRMIGVLGQWEVAGRSPDGGRLIGLRYGQDGAWVAELDPVTAAAVVLTRLREVSRDCQIDSGVLVCRRFDGSIGMWRLPA